NQTYLSEKKESAAFTEGSVTFVGNFSGSVTFARGSIFFAKDSNATFAEGSVAFEDDSDTRGFIVLVKESDTSRKEIENKVQINVAGFSIRQKSVKLDNDGIVQRHTFECSFSSKPISNQIYQFMDIPLYKHIKSALENAFHSIKISAFNPPDPNLQSSSRIPLHIYDVSNHRQDNDHMILDDISENISK
ncbi:7114_t:CDS:2, partial [Funneliformis mosseae]